MVAISRSLIYGFTFQFLLLIFLQFLFKDFIFLLIDRETDRQSIRQKNLTEKLYPHFSCCSNQRSNQIVSSIFSGSDCRRGEGRINSCTLEMSKAYNLVFVSRNLAEIPSGNYFQLFVLLKDFYPRLDCVSLQADKKR